ncbi:SPW repeat protein [Bradyrhizobium sp. SZCCHNRI1009]|uniref:SPW repeat protein n=1 Tax=Bradyrhizobium sp. SZCCHNRI1009 TaxID=3057277 RepID=UPI002915C5F1|nr:SPW repeat protein [Bradyrhizobium sp. SZCCHNRI1009]
MQSHGHKSPTAPSKTLAFMSGPSALDLYTLGCGLFLAFAPALFGFARSAGRIDAELAGAAVVALSFGGLVAYADWEEWLKVALGVWLIAAPWLLGFAYTSAMHVSITVGIAVTFLSLLELWLAHDPDFAGDRTGMVSRSSEL